MLDMTPRSTRMARPTLLVLACVFGLSMAQSSFDGGENGIIGSPEVECGQNEVQLQFTSKAPFRGKIFVKGHYANDECRKEYFTNTRTNPAAGIVLKHGQCEMARQRMLQPQGMQFSAVIIVSFHPLFITKLDRAFHVKCLYREQTTTVTANVDVSMLPTTVLSHAPSMPVCTYTIRKDAIDGPVLRYARVGQQVVHRWECQSDVYGMLVHSCYVQDGQGQRMLVVDENGCHKDRFLLGDPTYIEALNLAYREAHVFKFADRIAVRFECQIKLCMKDNDGCAGITPPICANARRAVSTAQQPFSVQPTTPSSTSPAPTTAANRTDVDDVVNSTSSSLAPSSPSARPSTIARRRVRRQSDSSVFVPVDGDFHSQFIYVLDADSAEDGDEDDVVEQDADESSTFSGWLRNSRRGAIVRQYGRVEDGVCLSSLTFGILIACMVCVVFALATIGAIQFLQYQRKTQAWKA